MIWIALPGRTCGQDLDDLWTAVLSYFEKRAILSEEKGETREKGGEKRSCGTQKTSWATKKKPGSLTFHYTACLIGILMYCNPYTTGQYNPLYTLNNQGFFHCAVSTVGWNISSIIWVMTTIKYHTLTYGLISQFINGNGARFGGAWRFFLANGKVRIPTKTTWIAKSSYYSDFSSGIF